TVRLALQPAGACPIAATFPATTNSDAARSTPCFGSIRRPFLISIFTSVPARPPEGHCAPPPGAANTRPKAAGQPKAGPAKRDAAKPHKVSVGVHHLLVEKIAMLLDVRREIERVLPHQ